MGIEVGGFHDTTDWPKMGPSLLIATCLILAVRTAKWPSRYDAGMNEADLQQEIEFAAHLARRVLATLTSRNPMFFPTRKGPWYQANDEDVPK
jgi:hypothetical protein